MMRIWIMYHCHKRCVVLQLLATNWYWCYCSALWAMLLSEKMHWLSCLYVTTAFGERVQQYSIFGSLWAILSNWGHKKKPTKQTNVHLPAFWRYPELNLNVCTKFLLGLVRQYPKYQGYLDVLLNHSVFGPNVPFLCHKNAFQGFLTPVVVV